MLQKQLHELRVLYSFEFVDVLLSDAVRDFTSVSHVSAYPSFSLHELLITI